MQKRAADVLWRDCGGDYEAAAKILRISPKALQDRERRRLKKVGSLFYIRPERDLEPRPKESIYGVAV